MKNAFQNADGILNEPAFLNTFLAHNLILLFENYLKQNRNEIFEIAQKEFEKVLQNAVENNQKPKSSLDDFPQWLEFEFVDFTKDYFAKEKSKIEKDPAIKLRHCFIQKGTAIAKELRTLKKAIADFEKGLFSLLILGGELKGRALNTAFMNGAPQKAVENLQAIFDDIAAAVDAVGKKRAVSAVEAQNE